MRIDGYGSMDATDQAALIARSEVRADEMLDCAIAAVEAVPLPGSMPWF